MLAIINISEVLVVIIDGGKAYICVGTLTDCPGVLRTDGLF
jgi:hypothetical protein